MSCLRSNECPFCDISAEKGFNIVAEDDDLIAFKDRSPAASEHLLVITRKHIGSVKDLTKDHVDLVTSMKEFGEDALTSVGAPSTNRRFGFHIPPFNSVDHIHLHCLSLPFKGPTKRAKYIVAKGRGGKSKGFSWFAQVDQVVDILEKGGEVGVLPC